ncbi:MAG: hypothetical protein IT328_26175 [Caldilineaceae bacterium]|nr:hypothetical protein [Caldilineaceae bacterium]
MGRWSRRAVIMGGIGSLLAACYQGQAGDVGYGIAVSGEGNEVTLSQAAGQDEATYIATIHSMSGIGQASGTWWGSTSPHHLVFDLHLGGLEKFSLRWLDQTVTVSIHASDQTVIQHIQARHQSERAIEANSPYWMEVALPTATAPSYNLKAPAAFIAAAPRFWGIEWIDFYR